MARESNPVSPLTLANDHVTVAALQMMPDYQPVNPVYSTAHLLQLQTSVTETTQTVQMAEIALVEARLAQMVASHAYHDAVVGARAQVVAQYGPDAAAVALVGLTRKSERKRPTKRTPKAKDA